MFSLAVAGLLAWYGRRELLTLSASYNETLEHEAGQNAKLRQQDWLRTGQAELATQSAGAHELDTLATRVLDYVARYLDGVVAAMYVRSDDGALRRIATYGFRRQDEPAGGSAGPALVAQAAGEGRILIAARPAAGLLQGRLGAGRSRPRELLLAPVSNDGIVNGVIELGFLRRVARARRGLLDLIGPAIGASVAAVRYRQRLQDALEERSSSTRNCRCSRKSCAPPTRSWRSSRARCANRRPRWRTSRPNWSRPTPAVGAAPRRWTSSNAALTPRAARRCEERADELQRASRYKSEFLANMSHELRTPLNSSLILAKLLGDNPQGNLSAEQVKFAESIYCVGQRPAGPDQRHPRHLQGRGRQAGGACRRSCRCAALAEGLRAHLRAAGRAEGAGVRASTVAPDAPATLVTDRQRVEQILKNLLSNAIKFTERGERRAAPCSARPDGGVAFAVQRLGHRHRRRPAGA